MDRFLCCVALCLLIGGVPTRAQEPAQQKKPDTFFAGTVTECTSEQISVSRTVSGKQEKRTFRITTDTKVEGKLQIKVRVTVQYIAGEEGNTATRIVVRNTPKK